MTQSERCPFVFNFDTETFKVGDVVSYRVTGSLEGVAFVGYLIEVHENHVVISTDSDGLEDRMTATRESRPVVQEEDVH
jgi:hypothetical protein